MDVTALQKSHDAQPSHTAPAREFPDGQVLVLHEVLNSSSGIHAKHGTINSTVSQNLSFLCQITKNQNAKKQVTLSGDSGV